MFNRFIGLLLAVLASLATTAQAQTYRWGSVAIGGGGFVTGIVASRTQQNLFYARTDVGGAYRWNNATAAWVPLLDWVGEDNLGLMGVESLALDPKNAAVLYVLAGTSYFNNGKTVVLRSTDYGATFSRQTDVSSLFRAHGNGRGRQNGERLQVDPGNSNVLYVGSRAAGLFRSTDAGATFARVTSLGVTTTPNGVGIAFVLLDPTSVVGGVAQRVFVGVSRYGSVGPNLYRSDNAGASFTAVSGAPADLMPHRAALASDGNLYITWANGAGPGADLGSYPDEPMTQGRVTKYNVSTGGWTNVTPTPLPGATSHPWSGISVDPANPQRLVVSTINVYGAQGANWGDQFYVSTNGGTSWTNVVARGFTLNTNGVPWLASGSIHWAGSIEFDPFDTRAVWVVSGNGVYRTANVDATPAVWAATVKGMEETVPLQVISSAGWPLQTAVMDFDGFRNSGIDTYGTNYAPSVGHNTGLAVAPGNPQIMARVGAKMFRSADNGLTWTEVTGIQGTYGQVALSANGATLLHSVTSGSVTTVYRSTNFTAASPTWSTVTGLSGADVRPAADPVNSSKFYVYDNGTVRVSTNGGASFSTTATVATGGSPILRTAPGREGDVWVALNGSGLIRSTNSGATFSAVAGVTRAQAVGFGKAATGATYPTVFIWGVVNGGAVGMYRSTDAGATWVRINDAANQFGGLGNGNFVQGDMNTEGVVYMATVGRGVVYGAPTTTTTTPPPPATTTSTRLRVRHSGLCLEVPGASTVAGTGLVQNTCASGTQQQWTFEDLGTGFFRVKVVHSGLCLDLASQSTANQVGIVQAVCGTGTSQQWSKQSQDAGYFRLKSRFSSRCMAVNAASLATGATLVQNSCSAVQNQHWIPN